MIYGWLIPVVLCIVVLFLAMGPETTARVWLVAVAMVVALATVWLLGGRPGLLAPYMVDHAGRLVIAAISAMIVGRFVWMLRTGERMF